MVLNNCAIKTPTNTTHYIHYKHFKRDRHVDVCERYFLCFGGLTIFYIIFIALKCINTLLWVDILSVAYYSCSITYYCYSFINNNCCIDDNFV